MGYTILVADDEQAVRSMLEVILSADGHQIVSVPDGKAALEYLRENTPDAVVLDSKMPFMDGFEICSRVKRIKRLKNTAVLLLSVQNDDQIRDHAKLVGADDILFKPLSGKNVRARIVQLVQARQPASD